MHANPMHQQPKPAIADAVEDGLQPSHADVLREVRNAVEQGDAGLLRQTLFDPVPWHDGRTSRWVMKPGVARALMEGFDDEALHGPGTPVGSFAELCFSHARAAMLREVLECVRPAGVDGRCVANDARWADYLCTRYSYGQYARASLLHVATFEVKPHSRDFIMLMLEFRPDEEKVAQIRFTDPAAGALITECEMTLRIRRQVPDSLTGCGPAASVAAAPRDRRQHRNL